MKLKYRRAFLLVLLSTMGMGILTLSFSPDHSNKKDGSIEVVNNGTENNETLNSSGGTDITPSPALFPTQTPSPTPSPTSIPTPTPLPVYPLEDKGYPKIKALMEDYYADKINCDPDKIKNILSNPADVPSVEQLQADVMYEEKYQNIKCYVKKSFKADEYIVYVYYEIKFLNIDTPAPAVDRFYVITDSSGKIKIFSGKLDDVCQVYYDDRLKDDDVQILITETNEKGEKAKESMNS
jgi:hypothetical protein